MKKFKIVLTGGPCAGKSEILTNLVEKYSNMENFKIFVVPETATEVLGSGIKFLEIDDPINFQEIILSRQLNKEQTTAFALKHLPLKENNLVFFDRGIIDNKAYLNSQADFDCLLKKYNLNEITLLDDYDLVIDLISLATTNPELYIKKCLSNKQRYETLEQAQMVDKKTTEAWLGHRNIRHIYPTETLEEKLQLVVKYIEELIKEKQNKNSSIYQIEEPKVILELLNDENSKKIDVVDYYLPSLQDENTYILRNRKYKDAETKSLVIIDNDGNINTDRVISEGLFDGYLKSFGIEKEIRKQEYYTNILGTVCKISVFDDFYTLEVENTNFKNPLNIIEKFDIVREIENLEEFYQTNTKNISKIKKL